VEQKTAETLDIDMRLTSRIFEPYQRWRKRVTFWLFRYIKNYRCPARLRTKKKAPPADLN
jgi:hypothetical protein